MQHFRTMQICTLIVYRGLKDEYEILLYREWIKMSYNHYSTNLKRKGSTAKRILHVEVHWCIVIILLVI